MSLPSHRITRLEGLLERARLRLAQALSADDRMRWEREMVALVGLLAASTVDTPLSNRLARLEDPSRPP